MISLSYCNQLLILWVRNQAHDWLFFIVNTNTLLGFFLNTVFFYEFHVFVIDLSYYIFMADAGSSWNADTKSNISIAGVLSEEEDSILYICRGCPST